MTAIGKNLKRLAESEDKGINPIYRQLLEGLFEGSKISYKWKTDGILDTGEFSILIECKRGTKLSEPRDRCTVLVQTIYYLSNIEKAGRTIPLIVFVGDEDECFVVGTGKLAKYFRYKVDSEGAPSRAAKENPVLLAQLMADKDLANIFIFKPQEDTFDPQDLRRTIKEEAGKSEPKSPVTPKNIVGLFELWKSRVVKQKLATPEEEIDLFLVNFLHPECVYLHPKKPNLLVWDQGGAIEDIKVNAVNYGHLFQMYQMEPSPAAVSEILASKDRLIDNLKRRYQGAFFTPKVWVDKAHETITKHLGPNWRDEWVVWDCSCGTGNLTRDYHFKELYQSTLDPHDIELMKSWNINPGSTKFQFDFLNDPISKLPQGLQEAISQQKPILFLNNPPYGAIGDFGNSGGEQKTKIAKTKTNVEMVKLKMASACQQLYAQFIYRMKALGGKVLATFTPATWIQSEQYSGLKSYLRPLGWRDGFIFCSGDFADISSRFGICFSLLTDGQGWAPSVDVLKIGDDGSVSIMGKKDLLTVPAAKKLSRWVREMVKGETVDGPQMKSALNWGPTPSRGSIISGALGYLGIIANNTQQSQVTTIFSGPARHGHGCSILPSSFSRAAVTFSTRRSIDPTWLNRADEFSIPDTSHPDYSTWENDCLVFSLFDSKAQASSLRQIDYNGAKWDIKNQFFWLSKDTMLSLANEHLWNQMYQDAATDTDRYWYNNCSKLTFSPEARSILDHATRLLKLSFAARKELSVEHPEWHLQTWDAGWYQVKLVLKARFPQELKKFQEEFRAFGNLLSKGVYKFGMLPPPIELSVQDSTVLQDSTPEPVEEADEFAGEFVEKAEI